MKKLASDYRSLELSTNMYLMDFREKVKTIINLVRNPSGNNFIDPSELTHRQTEKLEKLVDELDEFSEKMDKSKYMIEEYAIKITEEVYEYEERFDEALSQREFYGKELEKYKEEFNKKAKTSKERAESFKNYLRAYRNYYEATNDCIISSKKKHIRNLELNELGDYWRVSYAVDHLLKLQQADVEKLEEHLRYVTPVITEIGRNVRKNYSIQDEMTKTAEQLKKHKKFLNKVYEVTRRNNFSKATEDGRKLYGNY